MEYRCSSLGCWTELHSLKVTGHWSVTVTPGAAASMPRKISVTKELQLLEKSRRDMKKKLKELANEQRSLLLRQSLLNAWCDSLSLMQVVRCPKNTPAGWDCQLYDELRSMEVSLLQQLSSSAQDRQQQTYSYDTADVLHPGIATIAPVGDPMAYFRHHVLRPPLPEAASMTTLELSSMMRESTLEAGVLLHALNDREPSEQAPLIAMLQEIWDRCMHAAMSLIMVGREDIVETMNFINLDTLQPDADGSLRVTTEIEHIVSRLQLTEQQQDIIATGTGLYMRLLDNIKQERQQLQLQFSAVEPALVLNSSSTTPAGAANSQHSCNSQFQHEVDSFSSRHAQLEAEQQRMARLQLLMQKEYILRMGGMGWVVGCLTWPQVTKAAVMSWPFPLRMSLLAREVQQRWEEQQQASKVCSSVQQQQDGCESGLQQQPLEQEQGAPDSQFVPVAAIGACV